MLFLSSSRRTTSRPASGHVRFVSVLTCSAASSPYATRSQPAPAARGGPAIGGARHTRPVSRYCSSIRRRAVAHRRGASASTSRRCNPLIFYLRSLVPAAAEVSGVAAISRTGAEGQRGRHVASGHTERLRRRLRGAGFLLGGRPHPRRAAAGRCPLPAAAAVAQPRRQAAAAPVTWAGACANDNMSAPHRATRRAARRLTSPCSSSSGSAARGTGRRWWTRLSPARRRRRAEWCPRRRLGLGKTSALKMIKPAGRADEGGEDGTRRPRTKNASRAPPAAWRA